MLNFVLFNYFVVFAWNIDLKCQLLHIISVKPIKKIISVKALFPQTTYKSLICGIKVINAAIIPLLHIKVWNSF